MAEVEWQQDIYPSEGTRDRQDVSVAAILAHTCLLFDLLMII